ncbi:uncharacterized protein LOC141632275 [Silene latifolia]|uniref:uncharacterized protein LOC141632275 n=1 Tax=Silene latifolia TaxID=37657 RepID=UPI003D786DE0
MLYALEFPSQMIQWIMEGITTPRFTLSLNGSNFGYFQGKRGIRQDDLLMFCRGDKPSICTILRAFATFSSASGLFVLGLSGFREGKFPVRYLGIPIYYKRMTVGDCSRLAERVVMRIHGWGARKLSYAGRLVLVQAVLSQLHSFWSRIFIIPLTVMNRIEKICRNYLWSGSDDFHKTSPVAWYKVCTDKKFGGLGIVNCKLWNVAMLGKYVWWLAKKADHLWIRWVNHMYIKGENWLDYVPTASSSWTWRKLCQVKDHFKSAYYNGKWSTNTGRYTISVGYSWLQGDQTKGTWHPPEDYNHLLYKCRFSAKCWTMLADWYFGHGISDLDGSKSMQGGESASFAFICIQVYSNHCARQRTNLEVDIQVSMLELVTLDVNIV